MAVIAVVLFCVAANFGRSEDGADGLGAFSALVVLKVEATVVCDLVKDPQELLGVGNIEPRNWKEKRYQLKLQSTLGFATMDIAANLAFATATPLTDLRQ